jgi:hypothetical protein
LRVFSFGLGGGSAVGPPALLLISFRMLVGERSSDSSLG